MSKFLLFILLSVNHLFGIEAHQDLKKNKSTIIFLSGAAATIPLFMFNDEVDEEIQDYFHKNQFLSDHLKNIGHFVGEVYPNLIYCFFTGIKGYSTSERKTLFRFQQMFRSTLYSGLSAYTLKLTTNQLRPDQSDKLTFPSGHSATAFAFAHSIYLMHGKIWGGLAYSAALLTAIVRMHNQRHYFKDVVFGTALGVGFSLLVYEQNQLNISPIISDNIYGINLSFNF